MTAVRPSHAQKAARCEVRWLLEPDYTTPAMRFGTAVHALLEAWYKHHPDSPREAASVLGPEHPCYASLRSAGWRSNVGRCATAGLPYLPRRERCLEIHSEAPAIIEGDPPIVGTRDLLVKLMPDEQKRLGVAEPWLVVDFKTSSAPLLYAKSATYLRGDAQGITYPYSALTDFGLKRISARWVYLPSQPPHIGANYTDFVQRRSRLDKVEVPRLRARARRCLDIVKDPNTATKNPDACNDWNRLCPLHVDYGGPCNPQDKEQTVMSIKDRLKKMQAETAAELDEAEAAEAEAPKAEKRVAKKASKKAAAASPALDAEGFEGVVSSAYCNDGEMSANIGVPQGTVVPVGAKVRVTVI